MFSQLFLRIFVTLTLAVLLGVLLLDSTYIQGIKKDELINSRGIQQVVFTDLHKTDLMPKEAEEILKYWSERFSYQFSLQAPTKLPLSEEYRKELIEKGVYADVVSGWTVNDISLYYYNEHCDCVLTMNKRHSAQSDIEAYIQGLMLIIITMLAFIIYRYVNGHKQQVNNLVKVHQSYGAGHFEVSANTNIPTPYDVLAKNFNTMTSQIARLQLEHSNLINGVSHDLKTPIARIRFALDLTHNCHSVEQYQQQLQAMDLDLDELDGLINEWLFYAELNGKPAPLVTESVNFSQLITALANKSQVIHPNIRLILTVDDGHIMANPRLLIRAIENLITNSFKFTQSSVAISLEYEANQCFFTIEDDGPGITAQDATQITQAFVKLDSSRNSAGHGLGLAIVKSIIDKHHATLAITTSKLGGACFTVTFPLILH